MSETHAHIIQVSENEKGAETEIAIEITVLKIPFVLNS